MELVFVIPLVGKFINKKVNNQQTNTNTKSWKNLKDWDINVMRININHKHHKHKTISVHNTWALSWIKPLNKKWSHELSDQIDHKQKIYKV